MLKIYKIHYYNHYSYKALHLLNLSEIQVEPIFISLPYITFLNFVNRLWAQTASPHVLSDRCIFAVFGSMNQSIGDKKEADDFLKSVENKSAEHKTKQESFVSSMQQEKSSGNNTETVTEVFEVETDEMAENSKFFSIHRFNGDDYHLWKKQMEIYMTENKLKPYILGTIPRPEDSTEANKWDEKDAAAQGFLMRGLELSQLKHLSDCSTAATMWALLKSLHSEKSAQSVQVLLDRFITCKMENDESMPDYIAKVVSLAQRLKDMEMEQKAPVVIAKIM